MTSSTTARRETNRFSIGKLLIEGRAFLALVLIIVVFSSLSPNYLTTGNLLIMASHVAIFAILALGQLFVVLTGGIDLSVGSILGFTGIVAGFLMRGIDLDFLGVTLFPSVPVVVMVTLIVGALIGLANGVLVSKFGVAAFVATLGTLYVVRGLALLLTNGLTINDLSGNPELGNTGFGWLGFNRLLNIPIGVIIMVILGVVLAFVLTRLRFGRWLYATGGNARAAELSGVPVRRVKTSVYVISGVCSATAGLVLASILTSAGPTAGQSYELTAIAAVVIGGAALSGGRGTVQGTLLGAFVIGFLSDGLVIVGVSAYWQMVFMGGVIVVAVLLNTLQYGRRRSPASSGGAGKPKEVEGASSSSAPPGSDLPAHAGKHD